MRKPDIMMSRFFGAGNIFPVFFMKLPFKTRIRNEQHFLEWKQEVIEHIKKNGDSLIDESASGSGLKYSNLLAMIQEKLDFVETLPKPKPLSPKQLAKREIYKETRRNQVAKAREERSRRLYEERRELILELLKDRLCITKAILVSHNKFALGVLQKLVDNGEVYKTVYKKRGRRINLYSLQDLSKYNLIEKTEPRKAKNTPLSEAIIKALSEERTTLEIIDLLPEYRKCSIHAELYKLRQAGIVINADELKRCGKYKLA